MCLDGNGCVRLNIMMDGRVCLYVWMHVRSVHVL